MFDRPFSEIHPGDLWQSPERRIATQDRMFFATWSGDDYALHTDPSYAAQTRYGTPILHGLAVLSVSFGLIPLKAPHVVALYGLNHVRFVSPVFDDSVIFSELVCQKTEITKSGGLVTAELSAKFDTGQTAMVAELLVLMQVPS